MSATGPEGGGGAGSAAVATVGQPTAGSAFKMRSRARSSPHPQFLRPKDCVFFQNFRAGTHIKFYSLIQPLCFRNGEIRFREVGSPVQTCIAS